MIKPAILPLPGRLLIFCAALLCLPTLVCPASADPFRTLAKELCAGSRKAGVMRMAVVPALASDGRPSMEGDWLARQLTMRLVGAGGQDVVERAMIPAVFHERRLYGAVEPELDSIQHLGRFLAVDGLVTARLSVSGSQAWVEARLVSVKTGAVVASAKTRFPSKSCPDCRSDGRTEGRSQEARGPDKCDQWQRQVDELERAVLELKARYWAHYLKDGRSFGDLPSVPGLKITDSDLRWDLYDRIRLYYASQAVPPLTQPELNLLAEAGIEAESISHRCSESAETFF